MDANEEAMAAHKRSFLDVIYQEEGKGVSMKAIRDMILNMRRHHLRVKRERTLKMAFA